MKPASACFSESDLAHMRRAIALASQGLGRVSPNPPVGCVLVRDGAVVGEGFHHACGGDHAEAEALRAAGEQAAGATAYVTLMPCDHHGRTPPCTQALIRAGIARVIAAVDDPNPESGDGAATLRAAGIEVASGCAALEAALVMRGFLKHQATGLPFVALKYAMTVDGKIATRTGDSRWVSGEESRGLVQNLRAEHDAVLVGIGTALADDPRLTVRDPTRPQPCRVIMDSRCRLMPGARMLRQPGGRVVVLTTAQAEDADLQTLKRAGCQVVSLPDQDGRVDARSAMRALAGLGLRTVLCEGGSGIAGSLFDAGLVDEVIAFIAPKIVGGSAPAPVGGLGVARMADARALSHVAFASSGHDLWLRGRVGSWEWMPAGDY